MPKEHNPPITLRYHGLFDFDGMYAAVIDWAKNYGFKWHEKDYKHKVPSPSGAANPVGHVGHGVARLTSFDAVPISQSSQPSRLVLSNRPCLP
mgnify:CR=1 FL=1